MPHFDLFIVYEKAVLIMVCSPEQNRLNALKSTGPRSQRGKAIASRNATKHGLLSQSPPLLLSEDLESFQGLVQGLIDQYQPQTPTEHLWIQQLAMGWQRLHRLWAAEAASCNAAVLIKQKAEKFPSSTVNLEELIAQEFSQKLTPQQEQEKRQLEAQIQEQAIAAMGVNVELSEKLARYERHIWRSIEDALSRLEAVRQEGQSDSSMASIGQAADL